MDDATSLKQTERVRNELGEDIPQQYSTIEGRLILHMPLSEDMRLEATLNVTPEGLLTDIPTVMEREAIGTSSETAYMDFPYTQVKTRIKESKKPTTLHGTKETSQAEVLASTRHFFCKYTC